MPLKKGFSRSSIAKNIETETKSGRPKRQALAIALETARRAAKKARKPGKGPKRRPLNLQERTRFTRMGGKLRQYKRS